MANKIAHDRRESIVNKTALSSKTNQRIGGLSPHLYVPKVKDAAGVSDAELDAILRTHQIEPKFLRVTDFDAFFVDRSEKLLVLIEEAMSKSAVRDAPSAGETYEEEQDDPEFEEGHADE